MILLESVVIASSMSSAYREAVHLEVPDDGKELTLAFGSCYGSGRNWDSDIFDTIADGRPDVFIWLGDVAYPDKKLNPLVLLDFMKVLPRPSNDVLDRAYCEACF